MHSAELRNRALTTAVDAELNGYPATAEAFRKLAVMFSQEAVLFREAMGEQSAQRVRLATDAGEGK
jgi:hypothetical protein